MALEVEDGTGKADAESYVDADEYRAFWQNRNDAVIGASSPTDAELEGDLREGFAFVNQRRRFKGLKLVSTQAGAFPRQSLYDAEGYLAEGVPASVKEAQMRAARAHRARSLFALTPGKGAVVQERVEGVVERQYDPGKTGDEGDTFRQIDRLLDEWATSNTGSVRLLRA